MKIPYGVYALKITRDNAEDETFYLMPKDGKLEMFAMSDSNGNLEEIKNGDKTRLLHVPESAVEFWQLSRDDAQSLLKKIEQAL